MYKRGSKGQGLFRNKSKSGALAEVDNGLAFSDLRWLCQSNSMSSHSEEHFRPDEPCQPKAWEQKHRLHYCRVIWNDFSGPYQYFPGMKS